MTKLTREEAFKALSDFEPPICDLYVDLLTLDTVWEAIGKPKADRSTVISLDEHEQITRLIGNVVSEVRQLKTQLYTALGEREATK